MSVQSPIRSSVLALTLTAALAPATALAAPAPHAVLVSVKTATHPADASHPKPYDRIVFTFTGNLPTSWKLRKVDSIHQDGSGDEIKIEGKKKLHLNFLDTLGHSWETGELTFKPSRKLVKLPNLQEYAFTGDHAAVTGFGLGLKKYTTVTSTKLTGPNRVVVDIATS